MNITAEVIGVGIGIATFTAGIMRVMIIRPITDKLETQTGAINEMKKTITDIDTRSNDLRVKIAMIETTIKSLQHQIDEIKEKLE